MASHSNIRQELDTLSRSLLGLHKTLMEVQKKIQAEHDGKPIGPHELLGYLMSHPNFEWLRTLSGRIVKIDVPNALNDAAAFSRNIGITQ